MVAVFLLLCSVLCGAAKGQAVNWEIQDIAPNRSVPMPDGRIVGGITTKIEAFPYQVSLSYMRAHSCGGSIINSRVVVTAAHCVKGKRPELLAVRAGSTQHNRDGVVVPVEKVVIHPRFNSKSMDSDIALLILSKDLSFSSAIQSIEMATSADVLKVKSALIVSGWGATNEGSRSSNILRYAQVELINQQACARYYVSSGGVSSNMICAGVLLGGRDSCQGDSGGPLIAYSGSNPRLHGIVSWGFGCARPRYPGVYTKVVNMKAWVEGIINSLRPIRKM